MSGRMWARRNILETAEFASILETFQDAIKQVGNPRYCLIGGLAVAHHANPPVTIDADFLVSGNKAIMHGIAATLQDDGWEPTPLHLKTNMKGFPRFGYLIRNRNGLQIDILATLGDGYLRRVIKRAGTLKIPGGLVTPVASAEDLIVLKTLAGRDKDIDDIQELYHSKGVRLDKDYVERTIERLL